MIAPNFSFHVKLGLTNGNNVKSNCSFLVSLLNPIFIWETKIVQKMCNRFPRTNEHWALKKLQSLARKVLLKRYKKSRFAELQLVKNVPKTKSWKISKSIFNIQKHSLLILDTSFSSSAINLNFCKHITSAPALLSFLYHFSETSRKQKQWKKKQKSKIHKFFRPIFQCQMTPNWWNP